MTRDECSFILCCITWGEVGQGGEKQVLLVWKGDDQVNASTFHTMRDFFWRGDGKSLVRTIRSIRRWQRSKSTWTGTSRDEGMSKGDDPGVLIGGGCIVIIGAILFLIALIIIKKLFVILIFS